MEKAMNTIKFVRTRDVKAPNRANYEDAGIDFYIPNPDLIFIDDFVDTNRDRNFTFKVTAKDVNSNKTLKHSFVYNPCDYDYIKENGITMSLQIVSYFIDQFGVFDDENVNNIEFVNVDIKIPGHERILVPSGVKVWIEPKNSALIATNKSGVATKKGLIVGATTVDSTYTGEVHLSVINTYSNSVSVTLGEKLVQFIHTPVILSTMCEVDDVDYSELSTSSIRGDGGFGSTGLK